MPVLSKKNICLVGMDAWEYTNAKYSDTEIKLGHLAEKTLGKLYPKIGSNVAININLYVFILKHLKKSDAELARTITKNHKPIFSASQIATIKEKLRVHLNYFDIDKIIGVQNGGSAVDETRNGFWDRLFRKMAAPFATHSTPMSNYIMWWVFLLYNLEQAELYGPFISQILDTITLSLPVAADMASETASTLFSLAPFPYASLAGDALGYFISLMFITVAVILNNSRKHFGSSFFAALDAVPVFGEVLSDAAVNFQMGADRLQTYKKKMVTSVNKISPSASKIIYSYVPDTNIHTEPLPPINSAKIIKEVEQYVDKKSGLDKVKGALNGNISSVTNSLKAKAGEKMTGAVAGVTNKLNAVASNSVTGVTNKLNAVASNSVTGVTNKLNAAKSTLSQKTGTLVGGYRKYTYKKRR